MQSKTIATMPRQHEIAREVLPIIMNAAKHGKRITYADIAAHIGLDKSKNGRLIGGVMDLIDAGSALAGIPLVALYTVRDSYERINPKAFHDRPALRQNLIERAQKYAFTDADGAAIMESLNFFLGQRMGRFKAWKHVKKSVELFR